MQERGFSLPPIKEMEAQQEDGPPVELSPRSFKSVDAVHEVIQIRDNNVEEAYNDRALNQSHYNYSDLDV